MAAALGTYMEETAPVVALRLDGNHRVTAANAQACRVLHGELVGRPFAGMLVNFTCPVDLPALIGQVGVEHRLTVNTGPGLPETLGFRFFPVPGGTLALGSLDFQEQQQLRDSVLELNCELNNLTRQLHQAVAELRELNRLKNQFLGMAAHDLRGPIGVIMNFSEFVIDEAGAALSAEHREFLQICLATATDMKRMVDDFLDFSIVESGKLRLELTTAGVAEILAGAGPMIRLAAAKKQITLLVDAADNGRRLPVDVAKLRQVVVNLVGNAVEHSVAGQRVWVSARWDDRQLVFAVRDEGPGLTPEDQARLFQPFGRASTRKTSGERSVGLGLLITRKIVEAHGGRCWVESIPGEGATFLFSLPINEPPPQAI
jgi:signal transduction histidine kinase